MIDDFADHLLFSAHWCRYLADNDPDELLRAGDLRATAGDAALAALLRQEHAGRAELSHDKRLALGLRSESATAFDEGNYELGVQRLNSARAIALDALPLIPPPDVNLDPEPIEPGDEPYASVLNYDESPSGGWMLVARDLGELGLTTTWQTPIHALRDSGLAKELSWRYLIRRWT
ncbi:MAG: hypothetical protein ACLPPT_03390 [Mycobacterium sp.]|uniref:hypothetical protein n=1 Tax=Mycobacterium sp. TaxID=1785 RepID=UPI003F9987D8